MSNQLFAIYYIYYKKKLEIIKSFKQLMINLTGFVFIYNNINYIDQLNFIVKKTN